MVLSGLYGTVLDILPRKKTIHVTGNQRRPANSILLENTPTKLF